MKLICTCNLLVMMRMMINEMLVGVTLRFGAGQTPMVGSMTPIHGVGSGRTPMYGSQTPQHGDGQLTY